MSNQNFPTHWYVVFAQDAEGSAAARAAARPAHLARLEALAGAGRLKLAGPMPRVDGVAPAEGGVSGSVVVAAFQDLANAKAWAEADPYQAAGVYASVDVRPFLPVLP